MVILIQRMSVSDVTKRDASGQKRDWIKYQPPLSIWQEDSTNSKVCMIVRFLDNSPCLVAIGNRCY